MMRARMFMVAVVLPALLGGCGLRHRVDRDLLEPIPNEDKLLLFDAENDVLIAKDEIEAADTDLIDAKKALDAAESQADTLRAQAGREKNAQLAALLKQWADRKIDWREAEVDLAEARREAASDALTAARARYERAKALIVKEHAPRSATSISVKDFDGQVKATEEDAASGRKDVEKARQQRDDKRAAYDVVSRKLQQASDGAYGGPWAD